MVLDISQSMMVVYCTSYLHVHVGLVQEQLLAFALQEFRFIEKLIHQPIDPHLGPEMCLISNFFSPPPFTRAHIHTGFHIHQVSYETKS